MTIHLSWMGSPGTGGVENSDVTTYMNKLNTYMSFISEADYTAYDKILTGRWSPAQDTRPIISKVLSGTKKALILQVPKTAMNEFVASNTGYVDSIAAGYGTSSDVELLYLDEPDHNNWTTGQVGDLKDEFTSKDLIVNLQGIASQTVVDSFASSSVSDFISMLPILSTLCQY